MRIARFTVPGILTAILCLPCPASADPVALADQQVIIEHFRTTFVYPQFTQWRFEDAKPYRLGGMAICGHVNFQNSNRVYIGEKPFYTVVRDGRYLEGGILGSAYLDSTGATKFAYHILCETR
jgi:hypothetical protein